MTGDLGQPQDGPQTISNQFYLGKTYSKRYGSLQYEQKPFFQLSLKKTYSIEVLTEWSWSRDGMLLDTLRRVARRCSSACQILVAKSSRALGIAQHEPKAGEPTCGAAPRNLLPMDPLTHEHMKQYAHVGPARRQKGHPSWKANQSFNSRTIRRYCPH